MLLTILCLLISSRSVLCEDYADDDDMIDFNPVKRASYPKVNHRIAWMYKKDIYGIGDSRYVESQSAETANIMEQKEKVNFHLLLQFSKCAIN